ncbi:hypothetical protein WJX75_005880 [Coccomyxa subellipsoidea]|uniref:Uncharacterized protein n=1 Tax=Coccomyxa subellipsoidea TaxID=248742 RepID=A0ABR2Z0R9_9CHLO
MLQTYNPILRQQRAMYRILPSAN